MFPKVTRGCEVEEIPEILNGPPDISTCSDAEIQILNDIKGKIAKEKAHEKELPPIMIKNVRDSTIFFNSKFESGNLAEVERVSDKEYNLTLSPDFNTPIYT